MKPIYIILFLLVILLTACVNKYGSGKIITEERKTEPFNSVDVSGSFKVEINEGPEFQVLVQADDNIVPYIKTEVDGSVLEIKLVQNFNVSNAHMKILITMPEVKEIDASASADVYAKTILTNNNSLSLSASSSASILAESNSPKIKLSTSSGGSISVSGKCKSVETDASSGSEIKASRLMSENGNANVSSGANIALFCSVSLKAEASSGGKIVYSGNPATQVNESSGGSVSKLN